MESLLCLSELLKAVNGSYVSHNQECFFDNVCTDSRNVKENSLFVPLVGAVQNGHKYIPQAIDNGATVIFIDKEEYQKNLKIYENLSNKNPKVCFISVLKTMKALQDAAEFYVSKFPNLIKVSITGSSGKTTTKELMVSVAKEYFGADYTVYTQGNFNSETGLPLSVFNIRKHHKIGIFEMGMNRVNEIGEISKVLKSKYGIITNIGTAHIGILKSQENIALEKRKSFDYIPEDGAVFVSASDKFADFCCQNVKGQIVKFGSSVKKEVSKVEFLKANALLGTSFKLEGVEINLPLPGSYNFENALAVVACARKIGIPVESIKKGLENVSKISGRMEILNAKISDNKNIYIIKDCYNANLDSMLKAIQFCVDLDSLTVNKKIFVLGDMKELGASSQESHEKIGQLLAQSDFSQAFLIGSEMKYAYEQLLAKNNSFKDCCVWYADSNDQTFASVIDKIISNAVDNDVVLLKASHSMNFEKLAELLIKVEGK